MTGMLGISSMSHAIKVLLFSSAVGQWGTSCQLLMIIQNGTVQLQLTFALQINNESVMSQSVSQSFPTNQRSSTSSFALSPSLVNRYICPALSNVGMIRPIIGRSFGFWFMLMMTYRSPWLLFHHLYYIQ